MSQAMEKDGAKRLKRSLPPIAASPWKQVEARGIEVVGNVSCPQPLELERKAASVWSSTIMSPCR